MSRRAAPRFGSGFERLEDREVPAIIEYAVNVLTDTAYASFGWNPITGQNAPLDATGNTSLRAVIEYANIPANRQLGDWDANRYDVILGGLNGGTITLTNNTTLFLRSNFHFSANAELGITVARSAAPGTPAFNLFEVVAGTESRFLLMTFHNGLTNTDGGAIFNYGTAQFEGCTFTDNTAGDNGGAIASWADAKTFVSNCTFTNNSAGDNGGAYAALPESHTNWISNSTFENNSAVLNGGAVWVDEASLLIEGSTITLNNVTGAVGGNGGGVSVKNSTSATITNTSITLNTTTRHGGGLYVLNSTLTMTGGSLHNNRAAQSGGGFYVDSSNNTVTLNQVTVTQNTATTGKGGGGYILAGTLAGELLANQLTGNSARAGLNGIGKSPNANTTITVAPGQQTVELDQ
jgi:predicted outer membrane repeat protein